MSNTKGSVINDEEGGGATKREGGTCEVLPLQKRVGGVRWENVLAMLKEGGGERF